MFIRKVRMEFLIPSLEDPVYMVFIEVCQDLHACRSNLGRLPSISNLVFEMLAAQCTFLLHSLHNWE